MGSATPPATNLAVTSIRIEKHQLDAFKAVAAANRRSVSQELRWLIDRAVAEHNEREVA
jgi:hypothetical protein